jgi:HD superfamily phosphohydrolase
MDYLVRDALHTGATAGRFDYHRLLNTLTVIEHPINDTPVLAIEAGGLHAAEGLILARYFMFLQVYFHDTRRIYDRHLVDFLSEALPDRRFPKALDEYLQYNDDWVHLRIQSPAEGRQAELAGRLTGRNHFRKVLEASGSEKVFFPQLAEHVEAIFGDLIRTDEAEKKAQSIEPEKIYVLGDDGVPQDILEVSELILKLTPMWRARIYGRRDIQTEVVQACTAFKAQNREDPK